MSTERWAAVANFIGLYAVSDHGRVMSMNFAQSGLPGIMRQAIRMGYPSVMMGRKQFTVHSLVAEAFLGPRPDRFVVNHRDGDKTNNHFSNLEYVSQSENMKHACRLLLVDNRGEKHSRAKLNDEKVVEILERLRGGETPARLAAEFGVDQSQISHIKHGRAWPHIARKAG